MGRAKQLLEYHSKSLLQRSIENSMVTGFPVVVVLGANSHQIKPLVENYSVKYVINEHWGKGISTSIQSGVTYALDHIPELKGVLITLADQPRITSVHLRSILESATSNSDIVATEFQGIKGVPAYFSKKYLEELKNLKGDVGAMVLIQKWSKYVKGVPFPAAAMDIDTEQDWKDFMAHGFKL